MSELEPTDNMSRLSKRVFGRHHPKPCKDANVIECRRFACQRAGRCQFKGDTAKEAKQ